MGWKNWEIGDQQKVEGTMQRETHKLYKEKRRGRTLYGKLRQKSRAK